MLFRSKSLKKVFGSGDEEVTALKDLSFEIGDGALTCLIGPSGCGKTTTLRIIAGFIDSTEGVVKVGKNKVAGPGKDRGVVFQKNALLPWKSVRENVEFGLKLNGIKKDRRDEAANHYLEMVGLMDFADSATYELSGGMQQRVGLARALANDPEVLLMDEPFGSLDALTREAMECELITIWKETGKTIMFITHDVEEAVFLSTQLVVLTPRPGRVKEIKQLPFSRKFPPESQLEDARELKATKEFVEDRQDVLSLIWEHE